MSLQEFDARKAASLPPPGRIDTRPDSTELYGPQFNIADEINGLIVAVRAQQRLVMSADGQVRDNIDAKDIKDVVVSTTALMQLLLKAHEKVMTIERYRAIENTTIEVLREMGGDDAVERFCTLLEKKLAQ